MKQKEVRKYKNQRQTSPKLQLTGTIYMGANNSYIPENYSMIQVRGRSYVHKT